MKREVTLKFIQEIPPQYVETRKPLEEVAKMLVNEIRNSFNFNGDIEISETKEINQ